MTNELKPCISPSILSLIHHALKDMLNHNSNNFQVAINTVTSVIYEVCSAVCQNLGPQYIRLPDANEEIEEKVSEFERKFGVIQAFECTDGTHTHQVFTGKFQGLLLL